MSRFKVWTFAVSLTVLVGSALFIGDEASAYCLLSSSGCPQSGTGWPGASRSFYSQGYAGSNATFDATFAQALASWNGLSNFNYVAINGTIDPCGAPNGTSGWQFSSTHCGSGLGGSTLAVAYTWAQSYYPAVNTIVDSDITFNSAFSWSVFSGSGSNPYDFSRVAIHELGHSAGIGHDTRFTAIMNPYYSHSVISQQADDINAIVALYGGSVTPSAAVITSPTPGSSISGSTATFIWNNSHATEYRLSVGTTAGGVDIYPQTSQGTGTSVAVTTLPADGSTIHVRLGSLVSGAWIENDYTYTSNAGPTTPTLTSHANGTTLAGSSVTFTWTDVSAEMYRIWWGSVPGEVLDYQDYAGTSGALNNLPTNGSTIYFRLWGKFNGTYSHYTDYTFVTGPPGTGGTKADMTSPTPGSTLTADSATFVWTASGAPEYRISVGSTQGADDIYATTSQGTNSTVTIGSLPTDGSTIHVRLGSKLFGMWQHNDYTYTAWTSGPPTAAVISSPTPGSTLTGSTETFQWNNSFATEYRVSVGTTAGGTDIYALTSQGTNTSVAISALPVDGSTVHVRLGSLVSGSWVNNDYTYTAFTATAAVISSPTPGSTLTSSSETFQWNDSSAAEYRVSVGTTAGGVDIYALTSQGSNTSVTISSLPTDGSTVHVRLGSLVSGSWVNNDYTYTAHTQASENKAVMTSPADGSTLTGSSVDFVWSDGGATQYWLYVGTSQDARDIYSANQSTGTSVTVNNIPVDASTIYVKLWSRVYGVWQWNYNTYTAADGEAGTMASPTPGSTITGSSVTFIWNGTAPEYRLSVGTTAGGTDIYALTSQGTGYTVTVSGLPADGSTIHVRLGSKINGLWVNNDYTYTSASGPSAATLTSHNEGDTLNGPDITFSWSDVGAESYRIWWGNTPGEVLDYRDYAGTSGALNSLPTDGRTIYVRLWSKFSGVFSHYSDYTFTTGPYAATPNPAVLHTPTPGSTWTTADVKFIWTHTGASSYSLGVGTTQGGTDVRSQINHGTPQSVTHIGLPTDGGTYWVRLGSQFAGTWYYTDHQYTALNLAPTAAVISSPTPGSTLTGRSETFRWNNSNATEYRVSAGTTVGGTDIYALTSQGTSTSVTIGSLPEDGSTVHVRLGSLVSGSWVNNDYTYTAMTVIKAVMTSPTGGSTLPGSTVTFQWTQTGSAGHSISVGTSAGGGDIYPQTNHGTSTSATINGLPTDGSTVHVRLGTWISGAWQNNDYTYTAYSGPAAATITSHSEGDTLNGPSINFTWTDTGADWYHIWWGFSQGTLVDHKRFYTTSGTMSGLPTDGRTVWVRLFSGFAGTQFYNDYSFVSGPFVANPTPAVISSPTPGSTLTSSSATFQWNNSGASEYRMSVGTTAGGTDIYALTSQGTGTSVTISSIPVDGSTVHVRLGSKISGAWQSNDYTYTAYTAPAPSAAVISSPTPGSTLPGPSVQFQWNDSFATEYRVSAGTTAGGTDIYALTSQGTNTSVTISSIPVDGSTVHVRLGSLVSGSWVNNDYTYTAFTVTKAVISSPTPGSTLPGSSAQFQWNDSGASEYRVSVGTTAGGVDIYALTSQGTNTSVTVNGLPTDGSTVHVRLGSKISGAWQNNDYTYTAYSGPAAATITSHSEGDTLNGPSINFTWTDTGADWYHIWWGFSQGTLVDHKRFYTTSGTMSGLPTDGRTVWVRLFSGFAGTQFYNDYSFVSGPFVANPTPAVISSPTPGSTLTSSSATFQWNNSGASEYRMSVGTTAGGTDIYALTSQGTGTSVTISSIPVDGSTVHVRLGSKISGAWQSNDYTYTAYTAPAPSAAVISSPTPGSTLPGPSVQFQWNDSFATEYRVSAGTTAGGTDIYALTSQGTNTSVTIGSIPVDGSTVHVRLGSLVSGSWVNNDYTYTAFTVTKAVISSPTPGSTLPGSSAQFQWNDSGASEYRVSVGTTAGGVDIYALTSQGTNTSVTVNGLPTDGSTVHVRLGSKISGAWQNNDYTYTAYSGPAAATITSHSEGDTLNGPSINFTWTDTGADWYHIWWGFSQGTLVDHKRFYTTSGTMSGLPTDGRTVWVRLFSGFAGTQFYNDYSFVSGPFVANPTPAVISSPTPGSTLTSSSATFQWNNSGASEYRMSVGTTAGGTDIYALTSQGTGTSVTISSIPVDGSTVHVRLGSKISGAWQSNDYTYTAYTAPAPSAAVISSPTPGSTLPGPSVQFQWNDSFATEYRVSAGTTAGGTDIYALTSQGTNTSVTIGSIPVDGSTVHVRLGSLVSGSWVNNDYTYTAYSGPAAATLTSHSGGDTITGSSVTFTWTDTGADWYHVWWGFAQGEIVDHKRFYTTSGTMNGLPNNGSTIYIRLFSGFAGTQLYNDYSFTSGSAIQALTCDSPHVSTIAQFTFPAMCSTLPGPDVTFSWTDVGAAGYMMDIGTAWGGSDILSAQLGTALITNIESLPEDGSDIFVRLYSDMDGVWVHNDYIFTTATAAGPAARTRQSNMPDMTFGGNTHLFQAPFLLFPANNETIKQSSVTLTWEVEGALDAKADYMLYLCENEDFSECVPRRVNKPEQVAAALTAGLGGGVMLAFVLIPGMRRKTYMMALALPLAMLLMTSCGQPGQGQKQIGTQQVTGLSSGTTYYWKIVVYDGQGNSVESEKGSFRTEF